MLRDSLRYRFFQQDSLGVGENIGEHRMWVATLNDSLGFIKTCCDSLRFFRILLVERKNI